MGALDKFMNAMNLRRDAEYEDDYYDDEDDDFVDEVQETKPEKKFSKVSSINRSKKNIANDMELVGVEPTTYQDASEVMNLLLAGKTVILKLNKINQNEGRRLLDIVTGCSYAVGGNLKEFAENIFIVAPGAVNIEGAFIDSEE